MDKYEEELLKKIDSGEKLTKSDIRVIIHECGIESEYGDNRRWSRFVTTISQIGDRYFSTTWDEGLTEYQENEYYYQPVEVQKKTYDNIPKDNVSWNEYEKWNQNGNVIRNDSKESNPVNYQKVVSNVKWSDYTNISEDNSKILNKIHTNLNEFMIEHGKEKLSLLGLSDNKIFIEQIGDKEEIKLSKETVRILKEANANDIIFTHNHPGKTTFSRDDIEKIVTYQSINSLTLECEDGSKYMIQRGTCKSSNVKGYLFYNKYENIRRKVAKKYPELEDDVKIYEVWDDYMNEVAETVCNKYGLIYKKVK